MTKNIDTFCKLVEKLKNANTDYEKTKSMLELSRFFHNHSKSESDDVKYHHLLKNIIDLLHDYVNNTPFNKELEIYVKFVKENINDKKWI